MYIDDQFVVFEVLASDRDFPAHPFSVGREQVIGRKQDQRTSLHRSDEYITLDFL